MIITGRNYPWVQPLTIHVCAHKEKANCLRCKASGELIVNPIYAIFGEYDSIVKQAAQKGLKGPGRLLFSPRGDSSGGGTPSAPPQ